MPPINLGIIGYGLSSKTFQIPFILPVEALNIYAFLQRSLPPSNPACEDKSKPHCTVDFPGCKWYGNAADFFADPNIDTVIVCTQTDSHASYAKQALENGKNVVVEKPFTCTTAEAEDLIALGGKTGKLLTCYQNRRLDGDFQTVRALIQKDAFGEIVEFESHYDRDAPGPIKKWDVEKWIPGAGMLFGLGAHTIDQALQLFGRPATVTAFTRALRPGVRSEIDDTHTIVLQYEGEKHRDLLVTIKSMGASMVREQLRFVVRGRKGSYIKHNMDEQETHIFGPLSKRLPVSNPHFGVEAPTAHGTLVTVDPFEDLGVYQVKDAATGHYVGTVPTITGRWTGYYENLLKALQGAEEILVKPEEARDVIRLIELARESAEHGRSVAWS